jgi:glycine C-acetyltransferase
MSEHGAVARLSSAQGAKAALNGREVLMLGANDYLGLAKHAVVRAAAADAVQLYGVGTCVNPCFMQSPVHEQLEREVASVLSTEAAILFASCSAANAGVLTTLVGRGDKIFSDRSDHASIIDGCRLSHPDEHYASAGW